MIRRMISGLILGLTAFACSPVFAAEGIVVTYADPVKPDRELAAFVADLRQKLAAAKEADYPAIEALFAPKVLTFQRSLDPFQPWKKSQPITGNYLNEAADVMVEQGAPPADAPMPDFRPDLLKQLLQNLPEDVVFGRMKEVRKAICAPASYSIDRKAALDFAGKYESEPAGLRFYASPVELRKKPTKTAASAGEVPAYTVMSFIYDKDAPADWALYIGSNGVKGYFQDSDDTLYLSQQHLCFGKVKGKYRITAIFGFGL